MINILAVAFTTLAVAIAVPGNTRNAPPAAHNIIKVLQGADWGWEDRHSTVSCKNNSHTITFDLGNSQAVFRFKKPIIGADNKFSDTAVYTLLGFGEDKITMRINGEKRLDPDGKPVVWDLIFVNERTYTWRRHDWAEGAHTPYIRKCNDRP